MKNIKIANHHLAFVNKRSKKTSKQINRFQRMTVLKHRK